MTIYKCFFLTHHHIFDEKKVYFKLNVTRLVNINVMKHKETIFSLQVNFF